MSSSVLGVVLGLLVGVRHAFEPDHLTAVSTLATDARGARHGALLGALWGLGHTLSLVVVGSILVIAGATLPARAAVGFELGVAAMLLVLGARAIAVAIRIAPGAARHRHPAPAGGRRWRPLVVGVVHGLAGSGALTALVFAQLPGTAARLVYLAVFGAGSMAGMAIASGAAGATLAVVARSEQVQRRIGLVTGSASIVIGLVWGIPLLA